MATTTDLNTLVINYLTQAQYEAEVSGGTVDPDALYLTPNVIKEVERISVSSSGSKTVSMESSTAAVFFGTAASASTNHLLALANASSSGAVTNAKISGASGITLTNGTNQLTINNGTSYALRVLVIKF